MLIAFARGFSRSQAWSPWLFLPPRRAITAAVEAAVAVAVVVERGLPR